MEQRAPGHTCLDGTIYHKGMLDFKDDIAERLAGLDYLNDPEATEKAETLKAMDIACDAAIMFAERHADLAEQLAAKEAIRAQKRTAKRLPQSADGYRPMHREISGKPCRCTGSFIWEPSPSSTAGMP